MGEGERPFQQQNLSNLYLQQLVSKAVDGGGAGLLRGQRAAGVLLRALRPHGQRSDGQVLERGPDPLRNNGVPVYMSLLCHTPAR